MQDRLMTVDEVAALFHVSKRTVYRWNSEGTGPRRLRVGAQVFFRSTDIESFIAAAQVKP